MKRVYRGLKRFGHEALRNHVLETARRARSRHPLLTDLAAVQALLDDREVVRYPTELRFGDDVEPGYLAETTRGEGPDGTSYVMTVRRSLATRGEDLAAVIAYHLPSINYGKMASTDDAEAFGAALLGVDVDTYYSTVCALADETA